jgi:tight adherence protein B
MIAGLIALVIGMITYLLYDKAVTSRYALSHIHTRNVLGQVIEETENNVRLRSEVDTALDILKADVSDSMALRVLSKMPFGKKIVLKIIKAGKQNTAGLFLSLIVGVILVSLFAIAQFKLHPAFVIPAIAVPIWLGGKILDGNIQKRNDQFIAMFPDVLDMIVRSVRSGFPINSAISMVAENMEEPVKGEFRQVGDELALGRPLNEALDRLAARVEEQDIRFFVVVLRIQQETGGNLGEIISNLSAVIRKRKQLRQKIRAMTSEGRVTGYILSAIPVCIFLALFYIAPKHLEPLFTTTMGNILFAAAIGLIVLAQITIRKMIDIDI